MSTDVDQYIPNVNQPTHSYAEPLPLTTISANERNNQLGQIQLNRHTPSETVNAVHSISMNRTTSFANLSQTTSKNAAEQNSNLFERTLDSELR